MRRFVHRFVVATGLALHLVLPPPVFAAEHAVLGKSLLVKDPGTPDKRRVVVEALEKVLMTALTGDPVANGAELAIAVDGAIASSQFFSLPAGSSAITGKPFWTGSFVKGFTYRDAKGENGPVKTLKVQRTTNGTFKIRAEMSGRGGLVDLRPPAPGTSGCARVTLGGGDTYAVRFADGTVTNDGAKSFRMRNPFTRGVCVVDVTPAALVAVTLETIVRTAIPHRLETGLAFPGNDFVQGVPGDDLELTLPFPTRVVWGELGGFDVLGAVDPSAPSPGQDSVVSLYGSLPPYRDVPGDRFVLGDELRPYFLGRAIGDPIDDDFAYVVNVEAGATRIVLHGAPADYALVQAIDGQGVLGTAILRVRGGPLDLIGFVVATALSNPAALPFVYLDTDDLPSPSPDLPASIVALAQLGGPAAETIADVALGDDGDVYVLGVARGDLPADRIVGAGRQYIARFAPGGERRWLTRFGSPGGELDFAFDLLVAGDRVYSAGKFKGAAPGHLNDALVVMLDATTGEVLASDVWGGAGPQFPARVALGSELYVTGIGPDPDGVQPGEQGAGQDPYIERRDPSDLSLIDRVFFGEGANREPWGGLVHAAPGTPADIVGGGTVFAAGWTFGSFDDSTEPPVPIVADRNTWVAGFDASLTLAWRVTFGSSDGSDWPWDMTLDDAGFLYVVGQTYGRMDGPTSQLGQGDGYVVKLDPRAIPGSEVVWARHVGTAAGDDVRRVSVRGDELILSGHTWGAFPGETAAGGSDAWVARMQRSDGALLDVVQFGSERDERAYVAASAAQVVVGGSTLGSVAGPHGGFLDGYLVGVAGW